MKYTPQETAQLVLDQIRMHPETHDQRFWGSCVGGWAVHINGAKTVVMAQRLLGLSDDDAHLLFYYTMDNTSAVHALEYLAKGEQIDWAAVREAKYENQTR